MQNPMEPISLIKYTRSAANNFVSVLRHTVRSIYLDILLRTARY